jgi:hypothetical protein
MKMLNKKLLLCTFSKSHLVDKKIEMIKEKFDLKSDLFVFNLIGSDEECIITYNIDSNFNYKEKIHNTINLHRKKESNTLYTINALNELIKKENNGVLDTTLEIN